MINRYLLLSKVCIRIN